jgi:pyruvate/2-oxoglutarate/acetoin dehydrogenase E1 component
MNSVLERLNAGHHLALEDERVVFLGEDILDPYGGAFKVSRGLSTRYPERVLTTPISEAAIVGLANGLALRGLRPIVEIMFGDFVTLIADQLINQAAKFRWMYNDQVRVPLVVRAPMGGRRGYGPTHSQSLEKIFLGIPGLKTVAPNTLVDPAELLVSAVKDDDPVLFVEHKLLYTRPMLLPGLGELLDFEVSQTEGPYPACSLRSPVKPAGLTIATYGYNFELARAAALDLMMEHELFVELVVFTQLSPFHLDPLLESLSRTGRLLTVEEGGRTMGWGAEVLARCSERNPSLPATRVAALDLPIANARSLEEATLPGQADIVKAAMRLAGIA